MRVRGLKFEYNRSSYCWDDFLNIQSGESPIRDGMKTDVYIRKELILSVEGKRYIPTGKEIALLKISHSDFPYVIGHLEDNPWISELFGKESENIEDDTDLLPF